MNGSNGVEFETCRYLRELGPRRVVAGPVEAVVLFRPRGGLRDDDQLADLAVAQLVRVRVDVREAVLSAGRRAHGEVVVLLVKVELQLLLVSRRRRFLWVGVFMTLIPASHQGSDSEESVLC